MRQRKALKHKKWTPKETDKQDKSQSISSLLERFSPQKNKKRIKDKFIFLKDIKEHPRMGVHR